MLSQSFIWTFVAVKISDVCERVASLNERQKEPVIKMCLGRVIEQRVAVNFKTVIVGKVD